MREIKFRAWDKVMKNWMPEKLIEVSSHVFIKNTNKRGGFAIGTFDSEAERFILMQFTGLKDCNGKEIYEGDIVIADWGVGHPNPQKISMRGILWADMECLISSNIEVIGNIYENMILLDEKEKK